MTKGAQLKVKNWEQFQHYKDRNPPWIKLHFALLASEDWVTLDDASKLLAIVCMLIASRNNGMVPNNPAYLKRVAYIDRLPKLKPLIDSGFLVETQADASALLADDSSLQASACPETYSTEIDKKDSSSSRPLAATVSDASLLKKAIEKEFSESFWPAYPRKVEKKEALKAFLKARSATPLDTIMAGLRIYALDVAGSQQQFIRHASTWLNSESWTNGTGADAPLQIVEDDKVWLKRLTFARTKQTWESRKWGPMPNASGCRVPDHLIQPDDGAGWREWEKAA